MIVLLMLSVSVLGSISIGILLMKSCYPHCEPVLQGCYDWDEDSIVFEPVEII